jgi:hypothetical protein
MNARQLRKRAVQRVERDKWTTVLVSVLVVAALCGLFLLIYPRKVSPTNTDYEGTIVDRWADYAESDQGSRPRLRLVVESQDGKRFTVKVDQNVYESARVGMRVRSRAGQVVLVESSQPSVGK